MIVSVVLVVSVERRHKLEKSIVNTSETDVPECETTLTQASFHAV